MGISLCVARVRVSRIGGDPMNGFIKDIRENFAEQYSFGLITCYLVGVFFAMCLDLKISSRN